MPTEWHACYGIDINMKNLRKAAEMALEVMSREPESFTRWVEDMRQAREALREALAQPDEEPVAWGMVKDGLIFDVICPEEHAREPGDYTIPLYTAPPKREWVSLTDEQAWGVYRTHGLSFHRPNHVEEYEWALCMRDFARDIEDKLKENNT